jgi:hypothetical protein
MNNTSFHSWRLALGLLSASALAVYFYIPSIAYAGDANSMHAAGEPTNCNVQFGPFTKYDQGIDPAIAVHPSGLIVEFHQTNAPGDYSLWYHVGTLNGTSVTWGESQRLNVSVHRPAAAISKDGYVIVSYSTINHKNGSFVRYRVGKIDPYGGHNQSISWKTDSLEWDAGFHSSIAINDNGIIVGVHESGTGGTGLYYRIGHLRNPAGGDYTIQWDSAQWGIKYDDGINPHIAINNLNQVVEVHQVTGESLLHYRRGVFNITIPYPDEVNYYIQFGPSKRYDNYAEQPAVALLDNGFVLEVHQAYSGVLRSRTGSLSSYSPEEIQWSAPVEVLGGSGINYPALATNGTHAVLALKPGQFSTGDLWYSAAGICD